MVSSNKLDQILSVFCLLQLVIKENSCILSLSVLHTQINLGQVPFIMIHEILDFVFLTYTFPLTVDGLEWCRGSHKLPGEIDRVICVRYCYRSLKIEGMMYIIKTKSREKCINSHFDYSFTAIQNFSHRKNYGLSGKYALD